MFEELAHIIITVVDKKNPSIFNDVMKRMLNDAGINFIEEQYEKFKQEWQAGSGINNCLIRAGIKPLKTRRPSNWFNADWDWGT